MFSNNVTGPIVLERQQSFGDLGGGTGDRSAYTSRCNIIGQLKDGLDPRIESLLHQYFTSVDISSSNRIEYEVRKGVVPRELIDAMVDLTKDIHDRTAQAAGPKLGDKIVGVIVGLVKDTNQHVLRPTRYARSKIEGYDLPLGDGCSGACFFGVEGTEGKNETEMKRLLTDRGLQLSERLNSLVALPLNLLVVGENVLAGKMFRDNSGVLFARNGWADQHNDFRHRIFAHQGLFALASPIKEGA